MKISLMALIAGFCLVVGLPLAATAGPTPGGPNSDTDVLVDWFDNCHLVANASQKDSDHDGCGNQCDCDFNNDSVCNASDLLILKASYLKSKGQAGYNDRCDMDANNAVGASDLILFKGGYLLPPTTPKSGFFGTTGPAGTESQRCWHCAGPNGGVGDPAPCQPGSGP